MSVNITETPIYICPNNCNIKVFYQDGKVSTTRLFTEEGEMIEDKGDYGFSPQTKIKCRGCQAEAIIKTKKVTVTTTIE